ncbi:MAG: gatA [Enterovirga sp.]|nr:gatA [Enterovirga sp.]
MLSLVDLLNRIRSGALTPDAALGLARAAIAEREGRIGAFAHLAEDRGEGAGEGVPGPLSGIAVGVKDIIDTADMPTAMGSPIYDGWRPRADAAIVSALRRAGATPIGKTTTTPFAFLDPTATRNPRNPEHTPGGSSAGSAAAVAAGMVPLALGTQTGGSVIRPASFCGVAAIKPSFRLIPTVGVKCFSWTLDTVGLFAATVPDVALALELLTGRPMRAAAPEPIRFGVVMQDFAGDPDRDGAAALEETVRALQAVGIEARPVALPASMAEAWAVHPVIQSFEARAALAWEYDHRRDDLPPLLRAELEAAQGVTAAEYDAARSVANRARRDAKSVFAEVDAIITYAAPGEAPHGLGSTGQARFNRLWTLLGTPCVNVPGLRGASGLPVGIQVVAPFARDHVALAAAARLERALSS